MNQNHFEKELLDTWESTYRKGQLTLWLLLALRDEPRYAADIKVFVESRTGGTITCEDQSLYRALRKFYDLEIVDYKLREGNKGPDRKYYFLTDIGRNLLKQFIQRNVKILYNKSLIDLLFEERSAP